MNLIDIDELKEALERDVYHQNVINGEKVFRISDIIMAGIAVSTEERKTLLEGYKWSGGARFGIHSNVFWRR